MRNNPYIGPRPYRRGERGSFYGRSREARDLLALIKAERLVLFYAQSGAGKTSLLNAQIIPALEQDGFQVFPVARVGSDPPPGLDPARVDNIFVLSALMSLAGEQVSAEALTQHTLLSFLKTLAVPPDLAGLSEPLPILILDQFEEILTTHRDRWHEAQGFFTQLRDALRDLPRLGVVLAMREDHVAGLDAFAHLLPKRLRTRFRMELLGQAGALEAIREPARRAGCSFAPNVAEQLVDDLSRIRVQHSPGGQESVSGPYVEPVQLQVVCSRLWDNLPEQTDHLIQWEEIERHGNIDRALVDFYESAVLQTCQVSADLTGPEIHERDLRRWFGEQLITPMRTRGFVLSGERECAGLPTSVVDRLENRHIIRAEVRAGARWYELVHDRLVEPILQSNLAWEAARQTPLRTAAQRWQETKTIGLLYRDKALKESLAWARAHPGDVEPYEAEFLEASQEADKIRRRTKIAVTVGIILTVLVAVLMGYLAVMADRNRRLAVAAQAEAVEQRNVAQQQARVALSRQLAAQTLKYKDDQLDLALLLSLEANRLNSTAEVKSSLLTALTTSPRVAAFLKEHTGLVALSPDGKLLASGDTSGVIRLWDTGSRRLIGDPLKAHQGRILSLAFSPDGKLLASGAGDNSIILWDVSTALNTSVATRRPVGPPLKAHTGAVRSVAFSPDGKRLASGGYDNQVILWDVETRQPIGPPLTGHTTYVISVAFSPDGKTLASGSCGKQDETSACRQGEIRLWDVSTPLNTSVAEQRQLGEPILGHTNGVVSVAFSPNGYWLASSGQDKSIIFWDLKTRQPTGAPINYTDAASSVAFSPDGAWLAAAYADNSVILWDTATRQRVDRLAGHTDSVRNVSFSRDGRWLASGSNTGLMLWDMSARLAVGQVLSGHTNDVLSVVYSPDGRLIASGSCSGPQVPDLYKLGALCQLAEVRLWDARTHQPLGDPLTYHTGVIYALAFSPDGKLLASASADKTIMLLDVATRQPVGAPLTGHTGEVISLAFSPDGRLLVSGAEEQRILIWDVTSRQPVSELAAGSEVGVYSLAFSPDGKLLAAGGCAKPGLKPACNQGEVRIWDMATRQFISPPLVDRTEWINSVMFSPDGSLLAYGSEDNAIVLWNVQTRQPVGVPLTGHSKGVWQIAFSPDGKSLASCSLDGTVILWEVVSRQRIEPALVGHRNKVLTLAYSPDGRTLVSGSQDNDIIVWQVDLESWKSRACRVANRNLTRAEWEQFVGADVPYRRSCPELLPGTGAP